MAVVLEQLAADFDAGDTQAPRAAVYIGDGVSSAHVLEGEEFATLTAALAKRHVSVTSFAIGPQLDTHLLAALANQTGGMLTIDGTSVTPAAAATALVRASRQPVIWPGEVNWPAALGTVVSQPLPPLRSDRESIVVGRGRIAEPVEIKVSANVDGKPVDLSWHVEPVESSADNAFLARVVDMATVDHGATLPALGLTGLNEMHRLVDLAADDLTRLGRQALATGNLDQAERLAQRSRELTPQNADADALGGAVSKLREEITPAAASGDDLTLVRPRPDAPAGRNDGEVLAEESRMRRVRAELLEKQVSVALNDARATMTRDAVTSIEKLKTLKEHVRAAVDVDPEIRAQLDDQISAALLTASRTATIQEEQAIHEQEVLASAEERRQINEQLYLREQKITQSVARFNGLIDEGRWGDALNVINYARELDPSAQAPLVAAETADLTQNTRAIHEIVARRWVGALDTLASVERSQIPFPDEPPIVYPDAEWWQDMSQRRKEFATVDLAILKPKEKEIMKALDDDTTLDFVETPLTEVVQYLEDLHKIQIELDIAALDGAGTAPDTPITRNLSGITLRSALRLILSEHDLTYIIDNEVLMITTTEEAQNKLVTKVYPVADLVVPIQSMGGMGGGMGMMGGRGGMGGMMGGGMGGMGGGMGGMGGGMGGMGGGMGGMGGGMGMFNVPNRRAGMLMFPNMLQNIPPGGFRPFQNFAVKDELKLSRKPKAVAPKPDAPAKPAAKPQAAAAAAAQAGAGAEHAKPQAIKLAVAEGQDINQAWNDYFAKNKPSQADVRETARQLMKGEKFPDTIALLRAALRNGQSQPWMFEGLGMAMQAAGSSRDDIERALMSALDFSNRPVDFMSVGIYLSRLGLDERALTLFRQVSKFCPLEPEPYSYGLKIAQRLNDVKGIEWAVCGVLSQAWPKEQEELWKNAHRVAQAMLEKLSAEGRSDEAAKLLAALDSAVVRDIVVEARWDGDADVDILIEEPSGSVCSMHQPRTTAGGVLLEDAFPQLNQSRSGGLREVYACPQGFNGKYKVLVRRMWGKPTAGKVTVDVYLHANAKAGGKRIRQQVPVNDGDAMVTFELEDGRRKDPLEEQQLMTAASEQLALRRDLINQQLNAIADESSLRSLAADRQVQQQVAANGGAPFVRMPAAGFQPVIIVLPSGANLRATGVISADRRYVRFTGLPLFSGVSEVNTFNLFTGASGTSNGANSGGFGGSGLGGLGS